MSDYKEFESKMKKRPAKRWNTQLATIRARPR